MRFWTDLRTLPFDSTPLLTGMRVVLFHLRERQPIGPKMGHWVLMAYFEFQK